MSVNAAESTNHPSSVLFCAQIWSCFVLPSALITWEWSGSQCQAQGRGCANCDLAARWAWDNNSRVFLCEQAELGQPHCVPIISMKASVSVWAYGSLMAFEWFTSQWVFWAFLCPRRTIRLPRSPRVQKVPTPQNAPWTPGALVERSAWQLMAFDGQNLTKLPCLEIADKRITTWFVSVCNKPMGENHVREAFGIYEKIEKVVYANNHAIDTWGILKAKPDLQVGINQKLKDVKYWLWHSQVRSTSAESHPSLTYARGKWRELFIRSW